MTVTAANIAFEEDPARNIALDVQPLADGDTGPWDRWVPRGHLGLTRRFLACGARVQIDGLALAPLALAGPGGERLGVAFSYRNTMDGSDLGRLPIGALVRLVRKVWPRFLYEDVIEIGNPAAQGFPVRSDARSERAVEAVARWGMAEARRRRAGLVVVRDIDGGAAPLAAAALERLGFQAWPIPVGFVLPLPFSSFEDYRGRLRSSYRRRLANHLHETAALRVHVERDFGPLAQNLADLWRNVYERASRYKRVLMPRAFFEEASKLDEARALLLRRTDDSIAAFALLFLDGPVLRFSCTGFTREAALEEGVYFRLLYEIVRYGIENGCQAADFGATSAVPKLTLGAAPVQLHAWVWHRSPIKRRVVAWLKGRLAPPVLPPTRNVFREQPPPFPDPALAE